MDYIIKAGDNLSKIAQVNDTTVGALSSANNIANPNMIQVGKTLRIPTASPNASISNLTNPARLQGSIQTPAAAPVSDQSAVTNAQLYLNSQAVADNAVTPYETANKSILDQYKEASGMLVNKNADLNNFNNTLDTQGTGTVNFNKKLVVDLANQILANKTQGQVQQLDKGRLGGLTVAGGQNIDEEINRQTAIKNLTLGAQLNAAQGNLALAQDLVTQSIDAKYAPIEAKLANLKNYYDMNQTELTRIDKKAFQAQQMSLAAQEKDLEVKKKNDTDIQTILVNASSQNAPASLVAKAKNAKTPTEAAMILGSYAGDYWGTKTKIAQYNKILAETAKTNREAGAGSGGTYSGAGGSITASGVPTNSPAQAWLSQFNAGTMSIEDIYSKIGSSKTAEVTKNQLSQLIAAQGGKRVLPMDDTQIAAINEQIKNVDDLLGKNGYNYKVISGASQGGFLGFGGRITGAKGDALAIAKNLVENQTLQSLADAKAKGITFGALSESELNTVASAASRIAAKIQRDPVTKEITGFSGSESGFKADLETIKTNLQKSIVKKTGGTEVSSKVDAALNILNSNTPNLGGYQFNN